MAIIVDAGPLGAFFDRAERLHRWAVERIEESEAPLLMCGPVLAETMYLLGGHARAQDALWSLLENRALNVAFRIEGHIGSLRRVMHEYRDAPMSLADACLVRIAEIYEHHAIMTLASGFSIHRKHGRTPLALIQPDGPTS